MERLTYDEAIGLQWGLVARRYGELSESGPVASRRTDGLAAEMATRLPFALTAGPGRGARRDLGRTRLDATDERRMLQGEVGSE